MFAVLLKRFGLFVATNLAIVAVVTGIGFALERYFWIRVSGDSAAGYASLAIFSLLYGFIAAFISLWISKWMAKRAYGIEILSEARLIDYSPKEQLVLATVARISRDQGIRMPEVGVYESEDPNAFATGATKNSSLVAVSTGLLKSLSPEEIEAVVGHEMAHIANGDMVTMTLMQGVVNAFVIFFARVIGGLIDTYVFKSEERGWGYYLSVIVLETLLGFLAAFLVAWFSRHREYRADEGSAKFLGRDKMISALKRLRSVSEKTEAFDDGKLAAFKIASKGSFLSLLSSHPPIEDRINRLESKYTY